LLVTGIRKKEVTTSIISNKITDNVRRLKNLVIIFRIFFTLVELDGTWLYSFVCHANAGFTCAGAVDQDLCHSPDSQPSEASRQRQVQAMLGRCRLTQLLSNPNLLKPMQKPAVWL